MSKQVLQAAVFDYLTGQCDRHPQVRCTWLVGYIRLALPSYTRNLLRYGQGCDTLTQHYLDRWW